MTTTTDRSIPDDIVDSVDLLSRRGVEASLVVDSFDSEDPDSSLLMLRVRDDERLQPVDLERYLERPRRSRGSATIHDPVDFALYVNRLHTDYSTCWADETNRRITLVVNDHDGASRELPQTTLPAGAGDMGWRDHRAVLQLQPDPDWQAWTSRDGKLDGQEGFAEFLEDQAHSVRDPDAATMLEIATTFRAAKSGSFSRAIRQASGDVHMRFEEETRASAGAAGELDIPERFTIALTPFLGGELVEMRARLRYRIVEGHLKIGFKLDRPDLVKRAAFEATRNGVAEAIGSVPVLLGPAPDAVPQAAPDEHAADDGGSAARELRELRNLLTQTALRR